MISKRIVITSTRGPMRDMHHLRKRNIIAELIIPVTNKSTFFLAKFCLRKNVIIIDHLVNLNGPL